MYFSELQLRKPTKKWWFRCSTHKARCIHKKPHFNSHLIHLSGDLTLATIIVTIAHCLHFAKIGGAVFANFTQQNLLIDSCSTVKGAIIINPRLNSHLIHLIGNLTLATMHYSDNYALSALCKDRGRSICYYYTTKPACWQLYYNRPVGHLAVVSNCSFIIKFICKIGIKNRNGHS